MGTAGTSWGSYSFLFGPVIALGTLLLLILLLRWGSGGGRSLVARQGHQGNVDSYGLLTTVSVPTSMAQGEQMRRVLNEAGVRANLVSTRQGTRLMVFAADADRARAVLRAARE